MTGSIRREDKPIMQLSEFIEYLNFSHTLKATINKNTDIVSIQLLPEDVDSLRKDAIYLTTDCQKTEKLIQTSQVKSILCLCDPKYIKNVHKLEISQESNVIFTDPSDMTDLFLMRSKLKEHVFSDLNEQVKLLEKLITSESMEAFSNEGSEYLGHTFMMIDSLLNILCSNYKQPETESFVLNLIADSQPFKEQKDVEQFNSDERATYIREYDGAGQNSRYLISQFTADGKVFGYLAVDHGNGQITLQDYYKTSVISSLACKLILSMDRVRNPVNTYETLFLRLLEGNMTKEAAATECKSLRWAVPENLRLLVAKTEDGKDYPSVLQPAMDRLLPVLSKAKGILYTGRIVIFFEDVPVDERVSAILEKFKLRGAVSQSFSDISDARNYYYQTEKTLTLAGKLSLPEKVCHYEDMNMMFLLDNIGDPEKLKQMIHPGLFKLLAADREGNADLFETFAVYVECIGNINLVSDKLFVHRNTVKYRISKIEEILNTDLKDPEGYQVFLLSYQIIKYLKMIRQW